MDITIISRTIHPLNAPRSMRATNLAKEFSRQGHRVTIYAVLGEFDYTAFERKYDLTVKDLGPTKFATLNSDRRPPKKTFVGKVLRKLFGRILEYPDLELMFKTYSVLKKKNNIDLLITVAVPFPIHWGAALHKMKNGLEFPKTWIADCGDPYMGNVFNWHPFYFKYVEKWFCKKADFITIPVENARKAYYPEFRDKIKVIPQGFEFTLKNEKSIPNNKKPTFIYAGGLNKNYRDPRPLLDYLTNQDKVFKFIIYTKSKKLIEPYTNQLKEKIELRDYIPRDQLIEEMKMADFLVNIKNVSDVQTPSKLIDYAIAGRPILSIGQNEKNYSIVYEFLQGDYRQQFKVSDIMQYHIKNVAENFIKLEKE